MILEWIASGAGRDDILTAHPLLAAEDVKQALTYAARSVKNEVIVTVE